MISHSPSFQRLFDILDYLVDPQIGIIQEVTEIRREAGAPDLFCFSAKACNTKALGPLENFVEAGGTSIDRPAAMAKAIGEAIERYCSALYEPDELPLHASKTAPFSCIAPDTYALFSQHQLLQENFPYRPFTHETEIRWARATNAFTEEIQYVPAAMVYLPYFYKEGDASIVPTISTGLACHCSEAEAAISAICEVVERDAFTITWQAKISPPQVILESLSKRNRNLILRYEQIGATVTLFNITPDHGIPTILSVMQHPDTRAPALLVSAASHPNPEVAICKTLEELGLCRRTAQLLKDQVPPISPTSDYGNIDRQFSHIRFYCEHKNTHLANFLFEGKRWVHFSELPNLELDYPGDTVKVIVEKIVRVGHQVLLADVTTPDIKELGLWVVRAIIPGFHPLFFGHRLRALGGTRLWEVPQKLGHKGISSDTGDNPIPHPFP